MNSSIRTLIAIVVIAVVVAIGSRVLTRPDDRTAGQKISDAADDLSHGVDKAGRQLENRTPGEKLGDAVKDTGDSIKDNTK